jgi:hypothetical protein
MTTSRYFLILSAAFASTASGLLAQKSTSDLLPPGRRQAAVEIAERISRPPAPPAVPEDLPQPFNPADFDAPTPGEAKPGMGAAPGKPAAAPAAPGAALAPAGPAGDRDVIEMLAAQIRPSGMINLRGSPRLIIANKPFEIGTRFTVTYAGQDYELELTAIDRTTFTLRYRNEETTRPITPTK